ncbi:hypothetical protein A9179_07290 [Pseudomonas alcaligenes]|uniref:Uncharacterized protein n=1 Tax=Aquipseudomonas alcaligenes TaxID=43263 RepID=A0ABR7RXL9_AQUAC|nr:hypothetical protein [Pseudomonas alcaligenes]MBC9250075.1 hypothetical protein [Pseudomonas alcaligenes]
MRYFLLLIACLSCGASMAGTFIPRGVHHVPQAAAPDSPGRLIFSRNSNAPNACDVEIYLNQRLVARLGPGKNTLFDLPSGRVSVAVALSSAGYCAGNGPSATQSILLAPGETRQFAIRVEPGQVFLAPMFN